MIMLMWWLLIAIASIEASPGSIPYRKQPFKIKCPQKCTCFNAIANCASLDLDSFEDNISELRIVNSANALNIGANTFHDLGLKTLDSIHIENSTVASIDEKAFEQLTFIEVIRIINSNIDELPSNIISKITTLIHLNLSGSKIRKFNGLESKNLKELDMSNVPINEISENTFSKLPNLIRLNLESCGIQKIHPLAFINSVNLQLLYLAKNDLSNLMPNLLENNLELIELDLSYNPIKQFNLNVLSELNKLILKGCQLKSFNAKVGSNFDMLPHIDLSENEIGEIPLSTFQRMINLETINLSSNNFTNLDDSVFETNSRLSKIYLDNNNLQKLPNFLNKQSFFDLITFSCKSCNLKEIHPENFASMTATTTLQLSNNHLQELRPEVLKIMPSLMIIDVSKNQIREFKTDTFSKLSQLRLVNISGNPLRNGLDPNLFQQNKVLRKLDASSCQLEKLWSFNVLNYTDFLSIAEIYISNNLLNVISPTDLKILKNLQVLDVENNPLNCSPTLRDTIYWLKEHRVYPAQLKTHESMVKDVEVIGNKRDDNFTWTKFWKNICENGQVEDKQMIPSKKENNIDENKIPSDPEYFDDDEDDEDDDDEDDDDDDDEDDENLDGISNEIDDDDDDDDDGEDDVDDENDNEENEEQMVNAEINMNKIRIESRPLREKTSEDSYAYLSPTLVFILTAASVLVIAANIMLLILRSKGAFTTQRDGNLPHFKILQWGAINKMKKHSGSVYQQLSEERSVPTTPKVNRYQKIPTIHSSIP